ncbi:MAG: MFS transporter [Candidatus Woesearchaeota archaeon]
MDQIKKFYITSFLKNQTYFTPILIVFLQAQNLDYQQIFWVFTIGSIASFLLEIPTGIIADLYGKKKSVIISKFGIFLSFIIFGFAKSFWLFVLAQFMFEIGNSFRSGTETAFVFDYLEQNKERKGVPKYTEVKGKQKFWARAGESIATAAGGMIASRLGYSWVFFIAAVPAFINFILAISWEDIKERKEKINLKSSINHAKESLIEIATNKSLRRITINIMIFTSVLAALNKFIQPYMTNANIPIEWFGFIYAGSLALTALAVRYSYLIEDRFGKRKTINVLSLLAVIPAVIIGLGFVSIIGVILFFAILIIENIRSPIANNYFHTRIKSFNRATLGSILEQLKSIGKIIILPVAGFFAESYSLYTAVLIMGGILLINSFFFYVKKRRHDNMKSA